MSFGLVQLGQASSSLGEGELVYHCLKHLVNRFLLRNLASMHNHRSLFNMDISGGMPAVIIKMFVDSTPGEIRLLPTLPEVWTSGSLEGVRCRGAVAVEPLRWEGKEVNISLVAEHDQTLTVELPHAILDVAADRGRVKLTDPPSSTRREWWPRRELTTW